ncbi:hypothetical protein EG329_011458 [Mollisiaceae sp. DMI_Dod_QoI]|nr:hypothetical protein EG329_011458 [Helotiales sp. DMI_Dod_QoI]
MIFRSPHRLNAIVFLLGKVLLANGEPLYSTFTLSSGETATAAEYWDCGPTLSNVVSTTSSTTSSTSTRPVPTTETSLVLKAGDIDSITPYLTSSISGSSIASTTSKDLSSLTSQSTTQSMTSTTALQISLGVLFSTFVSNPSTIPISSFVSTSSDISSTLKFQGLGSSFRPSDTTLRSSGSSRTTTWTSTRQTMTLFNSQSAASIVSTAGSSESSSLAHLTSNMSSLDMTLTALLVSSAVIQSSPPASLSTETSSFLVSSSFATTIQASSETGVSSVPPSQSGPPQSVSSGVISSPLAESTPTVSTILSQPQTTSAPTQLASVTPSPPETSSMARFYGKFQNVTRSANQQKRDLPPPVYLLLNPDDTVSVVDSCASAPMFTINYNGTLSINGLFAQATNEQILSGSMQLTFGPDSTSSDVVETKFSFPNNVLTWTNVNFNTPDHQAIFAFPDSGTGDVLVVFDTATPLPPGYQAQEFLMVLEFTPEAAACQINSTSAFPSSTQYSSAAPVIMTATPTFSSPYATMPTMSSASGYSLFVGYAIFFDHELFNASFQLVVIVNDVFVRVIYFLKLYGFIDFCHRIIVSYLKCHDLELNPAINDCSVHKPDTVNDNGFKLRLRIIIIIIIIIHGVKYLVCPGIIDRAIHNCCINLCLGIIVFGTFISCVQCPVKPAFYCIIFYYSVRVRLSIQRSCKQHVGGNIDPGIFIDLGILVFAFIDFGVESVVCFFIGICLIDSFLGKQHG